MADSQSKEGTKKRKAPPHAFKPGQSGNPGGRPHVPEELRIALRGYGQEAIEFQYKIMKGTIKANMRERVKCSELLADRGLGRPVQGVDLQSDGPVFVLLNHETEGI